MQAWVFVAPPVVDQRHCSSRLRGISASPAVYHKQNPFLLHRNAYQEPLDEPCVLNRSD